MKKSLYALLATATLALAAFSSSEVASAQPAPGVRANISTITSAATTTGAKTAVRNVNVDKTYQVIGSTSAGTGTSVIVIEGSTNLASWSPITTATLTLGTVTTAISANSTDRFPWLRANINSISGTGAAISAFFGY